MITTILGAFFPLVVTAIPAIAPHPHVPKSIVLGAAGGKVTIKYFTVPYNQDRLASLKPGFEWHLGFATIETDVPLQVGDLTVPKGLYKLNARLGEDAGSWDLVLQDQETLQELQSARRRASNSAAAKEKYEEMQKEAARSSLLLPAADFAMVHEEHLSMIALHHGFARADMRGDDPVGGIEFGLRVSFGDLHREVSFAEVFPAGGAVDAGAKKKDDGR